MTARTELVARIAEVLELQWIQTMYAGRIRVGRANALALADVLADVMGDELARAWDEGRGAVSTFVIAEWDAMTATDPMPKPPVNPYRVSGDER